MTEERPSAGLVAVVVGVTLLVYWLLESILGLSGVYRGLFDRYDYWVPRSLRSLVEVLLVLGAVCLLHRRAPLAGLRQLGFRLPALRPVAAMALAVAPMWVIFGLTTGRNPEFSAPEALYLALLSPLAEEVVFRGFAFGQLWRHAGWGLWPALLACAVTFGYAHAQDAGGFAEGASLLLLTGLGGGVFTWLFARWGSLAAPVALHALMNLAWNVWSVGDSALAGWMPFALQLTTVVLAVLLTLWAARRGTVEARSG